MNIFKEMLINDIRTNNLSLAISTAEDEIMELFSHIKDYDYYDELTRQGLVMGYQTLTEIDREDIKNAMADNSYVTPNIKRIKKQIYRYK